MVFTSVSTVDMKYLIRVVLVAVILIPFLVFLVLIFRPLQVKLENHSQCKLNESNNTATKGSKSPDSLKYILLWTRFDGDVNWGLEQNFLDSKFFKRIKCPETRCVITSKTKLKPYEEFDAVLYHVGEGWGWFPSPAKRNLNQRYVAVLMTPPDRFFGKFNIKPNFFNWTSK